MGEQVASISVTILTKNEEHNIRRCIESLSFVDQIVVVDSGSTDDTLPIAMELGAEVYHIDWKGFGDARKFAHSKCTKEWVLVVDADEVVSQELAQEIKDLQDDSEIGGYYFNSLINFLGKWIYHSGWRPNYTPRLYRRDSSRYEDNRLVHEKVKIDGKMGYLKGDFYHYSYPDIDTYMTKQKLYSALGAEQLHKDGKKFKTSQIILNPIARFFRHYIRHAGFLDGIEGFLIAILSSMSVMLKYLKLRELERNGGK